jgi:hypothetical protein
VGLGLFTLAGDWRLAPIDYPNKKKQKTKIPFNRAGGLYSRSSAGAVGFSTR